MDVDVWNVHIYPANVTTYNTIVAPFINWVNTVKGGIYNDCDIIITEFGYTTDPGPQTIINKMNEFCAMAESSEVDYWFWFIGPYPNWDPARWAFCSLEAQEGGPSALGAAYAARAQAWDNNNGSTATPSTIPSPTVTPAPTTPPTATPVSGDEVLLAGTIFGNGDAWAAGREYDKVFDGDTATFFDCTDPSGGYAGIQLDTASVVTKIRFYPRLPYFAFRMNGGKFQGSTDGSSYTDLYAINGNPSAGWNEVTLTGAEAYTYLRYIGPTDGYCNVAEIEFYGVIEVEPTATPIPGENVLLSGTVLGHGDAWSAGSEYDKAFDGDTATYFDCADPSGGYTGIQLDEAAAVTKIRFHPRLPNFVNRMKNGKFQVSADGSSYTDLYIVSGTPLAGWNEVTVNDGSEYTYLRYIGADGTYCNVAEIEFYGSGGTSPTPTDTPIATSTPTPTGTIIATITPSPTPTSTPTPTATPTPTDVPAVVNLAPNPSFENDPSEHYWHSGTANFSWASDASHDGSRSLKVISSTSARTWWMSRLVKGMIPFTPGKEYTLKAWVKHTAGTAQLVIQGFNGSTWKGSALSSTSTGSTGWRELSVSYTPTDIITILRLDFWYNGPGTHWVDDIIFYDADAEPPENTPTPTPPLTGIPTHTPTTAATATQIPPTNTPVEGNNLVQNYSFESGQDLWNGWGTGKTVADDGNHNIGIKYCKIIINDTWRNVYQDIPVTG
ncbi:carbohydrate binding domain-containing protein, partial [Spirochaetota bacterium]